LTVSFSSDAVAKKSVLLVEWERIVYRYWRLGNWNTPELYG